MQETVLIVDDDAELRSLARDILLDSGYRVLEADNGEQALRIVEAQPDPIHVVLTDIVMPGIDGKELAERLAAARPHTKIIFMSGRAAEVMGDARGLISADAFLAKPFTPERLLHTVRTRLEYRSPFSRKR